MATLGALGKTSGFLSNFRWFFMPLGLLALVATGVHAAADLVDDSLLVLVERADVWLDGFFAQHEITLAWVDRVGSVERTLIARGLTLAWELAVDAVLAIPMLAYAERDPTRKSFGMAPDGWRSVLLRLSRKPTPMRLVRPLVTLVIAVFGAYAVARLVESTLFVGLQGDVARAEVAQVLARCAGALAMVVVVISGAWRATLRALLHADARCEDAAKAGVSAWWVGTWGSALALPMGLVALMEVRSLLSFFL